MTSFTRYFLLIIVLFCGIALQTFSQESGFTAKQAIDLVNKNAAALSLSAEDVRNVIVTDAYENRFAGTKMVYIQQTYKNIPIYNVIKSVAFKNDKVVSAAGGFVSKAASKVNAADGTPTVEAEAAVAAACLSVNKLTTLNTISAGTNIGANTFEFGRLGVSQENVTAKLLWVPSKDGELLLCWRVKIVPINSSDYLLISVNAVNKDIVRKDNLTVYDNWDHSETKHTERVNAAKEITKPFAPVDRGVTSATAVTSAKYLVIPYPAASMDESGGKQVLVNNPWENAGVGNLATTLGWHNDGTISYDSTRGNNVWAREDTAANNGNPKPGAAAKSTTPSPSLTFDFAFDSLAAPSLSVNQKFAITQLFYWNNIMHDISYQYGFDEVAGNFQNSNLARGGKGNDYVIADAQDGSGANNAVFTTPVDGSRPRMQMYLWDPSQNKIFHVNTPSSLEGYKPARESSFSTANKIADVGPVTGDVALYYLEKDGNSQACNSLIGTPLAGKVALIDRGGCDFTVKVKNAQLAGAVAAIVVNTTNDIIGMGGSDNSIKIPAVAISLTTGNAIKTALQNGQTVNITLAGVELDGDLDNGIIGHEYAHGISNRLTGGPSNTSCLVNKEQMGEGWSDYFALMVTTDWSAARVTDGAQPRPVGTYVFGQDPVTGGGNRIYPYSTDHNIDPWSYEFLAGSTGGEEHAIGEIWTSVLWDMTWNIIQLDGINQNLYNAAGTGGNSVALKLVTEGLKLQPCLPGFIDGRNAILKADTILYNGTYSCAIMRAFAGRGMGVNAKEGSTDEYTDQVADYSDGSIVKKTTDKVEAAQNEEITYTLNATCQCGSITNYKVVDTLPVNVTYVSGGSYNPTNRTVTFNVPSLTAGQSQSFALKVKVNSGSYTAPATLLNETVEADAIPLTLVAAATGKGKWSTSNLRSHSASYSLKAVDPDSISRQTLTTASSFAVRGLSTLSFWHYYDTEETYDKGTVEISPDSGTTWIDGNAYMIKNRYNYNIGFSGKSGGQFIETVMNLSSFSNKKIKIRFVFTSDLHQGGDGWYIDDIVLKNEAAVYNIGRLFNSVSQPVATSDTVTLISNKILPLSWGAFTVEKQSGSGLLKWTTMQEQNTDAFIVERSADVLHFEAIGKVQAVGNSNQPLHYRFTDNAVINGINYYRIRQTDKDGLFSYSEIRSLSFDGGARSITITPNPAKDKITISARGNTKALQVTLFTSKGEKISKFLLNGEQAQINISKYLPGVYYVKISGENIATTKKLVIQ